MTKLTGFVARSFDEQDEPRIAPILKFLEAFQTLGFFCQSAERAEVESVSVKVQRIIDESEALVGIVTRRHSVYKLDRSMKTALAVFRGKITPEIHTAPAWVLQEIGYALKGGKELILFREPGVEIAGLQGDLEYIEYDWRNPTDAFRRATEMISDLVAGRAGITVETTVRVGLAPAEEQVSPSPGETTNEPPAATQETTIGSHFRQIIDALGRRAWEEAQKAFDDGLRLVQRDEKDLETFWKANYQRKRFDAGDNKALDELTRLKSEYPAAPEISESIALCFLNYGQHDEAARHFQEAARLENAEGKLNYLIRAADCLKEGKRYSEAEQIVRGVLREASGDARNRALRALYGIVRGSGHTHSAFGIAEIVLQENPANNQFRFKVGLDYHKDNINELFLKHYKTYCAHNPDNGPGYHNLALAYSECSLPIRSVDSYKKAISLGETLSASNLAYRYLEAGFSEEAKGLLEDARKREDCEPAVTACLGDIEDRRKREKEEEDTKHEETDRHRECLLEVGKGYLFDGNLAAEGKWEFPFGVIEMNVSEGKLVGVLEREEEKRELFTLFGKPPDTKKVRKAFRFSGQLEGASCKFELEEEEEDKVAGYLRGLLGSDTKKTEGFVVFSGDGKIGTVFELKDRRLTRAYEIKRFS